MTCAVCLGRCPEALANPFRALRQISEPFEQRPQIKAGADGEDGQPRTRLEVGKNSQGALAIAAGGSSIGRIQNVEQMVWHVLALGPRWLGSAKVKAPVELRGIAGNDFAAELLR